MSGEEDGRAVACQEHQECDACREFELAEAAAKRERDASRETDCRVLRRRHQAAVHEARP